MMRDRWSHANSPASITTKATPAKARQVSAMRSAPRCSSPTASCPTGSPPKRAAPPAARSPALRSAAKSMRSPAVSERQVFELYGMTPSASVPGVTNLFGFDEITALVNQASDGAHDLDYGDNAGAGATGGIPYRRLIDHARTIYRHNDLSGA